MIYNPRAGRLLRDPSILPRTVEILGSRICRPRLLATAASGTAGALARQAIADGADLILAAGGDGTVNEIVGGMAGSLVPLAVLPAGTANVFAIETRLGTSMEEAARRLGEFIPRRIALGRLTREGVSRPFLLMAGVGLDARIVHSVDPRLKAKSGKLSYWVAGLSLLGGTLEEFEVEVDGLPRRCSFALVSRVRNYGGDFQIARSTSLFDDHFEVVLFEGRHALAYVPYLFGMLSGRLHRRRGVTFLRAARVCVNSLTAAPIHIHVDGECAGRAPATLDLIPDAVTVLLPPAYTPQQ